MSFFPSALLRWDAVASATTGGFAMPETETRAITTWAAGFAVQAADDAEVNAFAGLIDDGILAQIPELAEDPMIVHDLHESTRHHIIAFLAALGLPEHQLSLPRQAEDLVRTLARRGKDLPVLLKIYREAHSGVLAYFSQAVDQLDDTAPPREDVLKFLWLRSDQWIDDSVERLIETFYDEREQLHDGALARRAAMVDALLDGSTVDVDEATEVLAHPMRRWQTGFVLWADQADRVTSDFLQSSAAELATVLRGSKALTHVAGSRELWCWVATLEPPQENAMAMLEPALRGRDVRVAMGFPAQGIEGFRSSHTEARAAQRLSLLARHRQPVVAYRDVEMLALALENDALLRRMVEREAGPLYLDASAEKSLAPVRSTVLTFLTNRMNVEATADQLFVHKNTVRYRLSRAEELLGRPLALRPAQLELALRYLAWFGAPAEVAAR